MTVLNESELVFEAHDRVDRCIETGEVAELNVVGFGEITLAVAWPTEDPRIVVKRLPPFASYAALEDYRGLLVDWVAAMESRGVAVVDTGLHAVEHPRWGVIAYLTQPLLGREDLAANRCLKWTDEEARPILTAVVDAIGHGIDDHLAFDAQLTNWAVRPDGTLAMMDVSTPFLRDARGRNRLATELVAGSYPAVLRPMLNRLVLPGVIDAYHAPRTAVRDFAGNLVRLGLDRHLDVVLTHAREAFGIDLEESEVRDFFEKDTRMWSVLQGLRRTDRWWQRHVRRRPYPVLMPPRYDNRTDFNSNLR